MTPFAWAVTAGGATVFALGVFLVYKFIVLPLSDDLMGPDE